MNINVAKLKKKYNGLATKIGQIAVPMMIGLILIGFVGLGIILGLTIAIPLMIGMVAPANPEEKRTWAGLTTGQKGGLSVLLVVMLPVLAMMFLALLWIGVAWYIDLMFIIPIAIIVIYLILNRGVRESDVRTEKGILHKMFSSKVMGAIGLIVIIAILLFASYGYSTEQPSIDRGSDGAVDSEVTGDPDNDTVDPDDIITNTTVYIKVIDDFFIQAPDGSPAPIEPGDFVTVVDNGTQTMNMEAVDGDYPLEFVKVTIFAYDIITGETKNMVNHTDQNGIVGFDGMPEGVWFFSADRTLYREFNGNFTLTEEFVGRDNMTYEDAISEPDIMVHMTPIMYKIRLSYNIIYTDEFNEATYEENADFLWELSGGTGTLGTYASFEEKMLLHDLRSNFSVSVTGEMLGALDLFDMETATRQADWYGWTTIELGTGNQMFAIKQSMMSAYNSIWGVLNQLYFAGQSVLGINRSYFVDEAIVDEYANYQGHRYSIDIAEDGAGESVYVATLPTNNTIKNKTFWNSDTSTTISMSTLSYREMEFVVFSPKEIDENNTLYLGFTFYTYFSLANAWYIGDSDTLHQQFGYDIPDIEVGSGDFWTWFYDKYEYVDTDDRGDFMRTDQFLITINDERPTQTAQDFHLGEEGDFP